MKERLLKVLLLIGLTLILVLFTTVAVRSQDTVRLKHLNYTAVFSKSKYYPVLVEWWVTRAKVGCEKPLPRVDKFRPDPLLPRETNLADDYKGSGLDRGHMSPAADNQCQTPAIQEECFYFSNMAAQYHSLNAGDWKSLEMATREWALRDDSIHVWAGNLGEVKRVGKVAVPKECWKVVYDLKTKEWFFFMFDNTPNKSTGLKSHEVPREVLEKATGFKFN